MDDTLGNITIPLDMSGGILVEELKVLPLVILNATVVEIAQDDWVKGPVKRRCCIKELDKEDLVLSHCPCPLLCHHDVGHLDKQTWSEA